MEDKEQSITIEQAYLAMFSFLDNLYQRTKSDVLGGLLGSMSFLGDKGTADPAVWAEWLNCVQSAREGRVDALLRLG